MSEKMERIETIICACVCMHVCVVRVCVCVILTTEVERSTGLWSRNTAKAHQLEFARDGVARSQ